VQLRAVEAERLDLDQHPTVLGYGDRQVAEDQRLGRSWGVEHGGTHGGHCSSFGSGALGCAQLGERASQLLECGCGEHRAEALLERVLETGGGCGECLAPGRRELDDGGAPTVRVVPAPAVADRLDAVDDLADAT